MPLVELPAPRRRVVDQLRSRPGGRTVAELTDALGGHPNTVRAQLARLLSEGLVERVTTPSETRGRPAHAYALTEAGELLAAAASVATPVANDDLIAAVAAHLATVPEPAEHARAIGRRWADQLLPAGRPATADPVGEVTSLLASAGFSPMVEQTPGSVDIALRTCPVLESARAHPEVVCTIHEGMLRAALDRAGGDATDARLEPFARPGACLVRLRAGVA